MSDLTNANHWIEIVHKQAGELGAHTLVDLARNPLAQQATISCPVCGVAIPVPDGSLRAHLQRRTAELGGEHSFVTFRIAHQPNVARPPGTTFALLQKARDVRQLSPEQLQEAYVYPNPDSSKPPEEQERYKVKDLLKRQKEENS